jgi:hypothetical protein
MSDTATTTTHYIARVRFLKRHTIYNAGEVAVFPLGEAQRLVASRVAEALPPPIPLTPPPGGQEGATGVPARGPASVVRK